MKIRNQELALPGNLLENEELISPLEEKLKDGIFNQDLNILEDGFKNAIMDFLYIRSLENQYLSSLNEKVKLKDEAVKLGAKENRDTPRP